tara:strand:- start:19911 stop:20210 length:300 start_codon:yes stop_codon:yes gene_type:complete
MSFLDRLGFGKAESTESADAVNTGDELIRLAESNPDVVGHELSVFEAEVDRIKQQAQMGDGMSPDDWNLVDQAASRSAQELSGYGIAVTAEAFKGALDS